MTDKASENRINQLHPKIREIALEAYREAVRITPVGVHPVITETLRSFKRSADLYAQGRTRPGHIVTNAKPGQSFHNYGLALDFVNSVNGQLTWNVDENWMKVVNAFKKRGFKWGGDWKSLKDYPHIELTLGYSWQELLSLHSARQVDKNGYVLIKGGDHSQT